MTTHKEALTLALEEIKRVKEICLREVGIGLCNEVVIAKIEEALAQPEQEPTNLERHERNVQQLFGTPQPKEPEQEPKCNPHPKAPHGFNRNASHANDRYTCECESWDAYDAGYQAGVMAGIEASMGEPKEPEQEPACCTGNCPNKKECSDAMQCLYTTPPYVPTERQRKPKNLMQVKRISDQSIELVFTSCAAASEFENGIKE